MQTSRDTVPAVVVEGKITTELVEALMKKSKNNLLRNRLHSCRPKQIGPQSNIDINSNTCLEIGCFSKCLS